MGEPRRDDRGAAEQAPPEGTDGTAPTSWSLSRFVGGVLVGIGILCGGLTGYLLSDARRTRISPEAESKSPGVPTAARVSVESQIAARRLAVFTGMESSPTAPSEVAASGFVPTLALNPPYEVIDSAVFDADDKRIRLVRILPIGRQEVCTDADGRRFACGLMGRAALQNLLARHSITCVPLFLARQARVDHIDADCTIDGSDVAERLVLAGFAFPSLLAGDRLTDALDEARANRAGVWSGPYVSSRVDHAIEDSRAVGVAPQRSPASDGRDVRWSTADRPMAGSVGAPELPSEVRRPAKREEPARTKSRAPAPDPVRIRPAAAASAATRPPDREPPRPSGVEAPRTGVVAGPILPPPEALARKLGGATSTTRPVPGDNGRENSDR